MAWPLKFLSIKEIEENVDGFSKREVRKKQRALEQSINEGAVASFPNGIAETYITPFALLLKASSFQIGALGALQGLVTPISQLFGSRLMTKHPRKKIVTISVFLQSLIWIFLAILSASFFLGYFQKYGFYLLAILLTLFLIAGGIAFPPWFSWLGDLMPPKSRGRFLSTRNIAIGLVNLSSVIIGAILLDRFQKLGFALIGFGVLFSLAFIFRIISYKILKKIYIPKFKIKKGEETSLIGFLKAPSDYRKFSIYQAIFYFSIMLASPFSAVYMLKELQFSYLTFTLVAISSTIFYLVFSPLTGKFSDIFGNIKLFYISNFLFALSPILWIFIKSPIWLIIIPQLVAGLANASFVIATTNYTYSSVSPSKRGALISYSNLLLGIGLLLGSLIGGYLIDYVPTRFNPFLLVFAIAALARLLTGIIFLPGLKEQSRVEKLPPMHINLYHPFDTIHHEIGWIKAIFK